VWNGADAVAIGTGPSAEEIRYLKSISLHLWLFGYELPGAIRNIRCLLENVQCLLGNMHLWTSGWSTRSGPS
jgi:nucleosome binding factor SPN SPT16 subunit